MLQACLLGALGQMCPQRGKSKILLPDHENVIRHVDVLFLSSNLDLVADWNVIKYNFTMTTLLKLKVDDLRRSFPRFRVDVGTYYDVMTRCRYTLTFFWCL